jgi:hypothetical protein
VESDAFDFYAKMSPTIMIHLPRPIQASTTKVADKRIHFSPILTEVVQLEKSARRGDSGQRVCLTAAKDLFISQGTLADERGIYLKQHLRDQLIEHKHNLDKNGEDLPEILRWKWIPPNDSFSPDKVIRLTQI